MPSHQERRTPLPDDYQFPAKGAFAEVFGVPESEFLSIHEAERMRTRHDAPRTVFAIYNPLGRHRDRWSGCL